MLARCIVTYLRPIPESAAMGIRARAAKKWLARHPADAVACLKNRSSRPHYPPRALARPMLPARPLAPSASQLARDRPAARLWLDSRYRGASPRC